MASKITDKCECCKKVKELTYYGNAPDEQKDRSQNGEWLCAECIAPRAEALGDAIKRFRKILGKE
jgi:uncharacterized protein CbrC (UPF0167 family)